ncbi:MAG: hypothetical protein M1819_005046 [Sarea resinae]|nr:MAG: hypothetical protein M1819_005046 [Sarea resinae]
MRVEYLEISERSPTARQYAPSEHDTEEDPQGHDYLNLEQPPRGTDDGVPVDWEPFDDMLLWSFRGNATQVQAQAQHHWNFDPPLSLDWVSTRLSVSAAAQLQHLESLLPGESDMILRVQVRIGTAGDPRREEPTPGDWDDLSDTYLPSYTTPPMPEGQPADWNRLDDVEVYLALTSGEEPSTFCSHQPEHRVPEVTEGLRDPLLHFVEERMCQARYLAVSMREVTEMMESRPERNFSVRMQNLGM